MALFAAFYVGWLNSCLVDWFVSCVWFGCFGCLFSRWSPAHLLSGRGAVGHRRRDCGKVVHIARIGRSNLGRRWSALRVVVVRLLPGCAAHNEAFGRSVGCRVVVRLLARRMHVGLLVDHVLQVLLLQILDVVARVVDRVRVVAAHDHHVRVASAEFHLNLELVGDFGQRFALCLRIKQK